MNDIESLFTGFFIFLYLNICPYIHFCFLKLQQSFPRFNLSTLPFLKSWLTSQELQQKLITAYCKLLKLLYLYSLGEKKNLSYKKPNHYEAIGCILILDLFLLKVQVSLPGNAISQKHLSIQGSSIFPTSINAERKMKTSLQYIKKLRSTISLWLSFWYSFQHLVNICFYYCVMVMWKIRLFLKCH